MKGKVAGIITGLVLFIFGWMGGQFLSSRDIPVPAPFFDTGRYAGESADVLSLRDELPAWLGGVIPGAEQFAAPGVLLFAGYPPMTAAAGLPFLRDFHDQFAEYGYDLREIWAGESVCVAGGSLWFRDKNGKVWSGPFFLYVLADVWKGGKPLITEYRAVWDRGILPGEYILPPPER